MPESQQTIGTYLIQSLYDHGVRYVFGVPGDFVLGFYQQLNDSNKLKIITLELVEFFDDMFDYNLKSLKEYVESKEKNKRIGS